jgi:hypothetical protein
METNAIIQIVQTLGFGGVIFVIWWFDYRRFKQQDELLRSYRDMAEDYKCLADETLRAIKENTAQLRAMKDRIYNAEELASALMLVTQVLTKLTERAEMISRKDG